MQKKPIQPPTGIQLRHSRSCSTEHGGDCDCEPSYRAVVYNPRAKKTIRKTFSGKGALSAAKGWRTDHLALKRRGPLPLQTRLTLRDAADAWLEAIKRGEVLSRHRRP